MKYMSGLEATNPTTNDGPMVKRMRFAVYVKSKSSMHTAGHLDPNLHGGLTNSSMDRSSLAPPDVPGKGTSGHYCQHSVIQWNLIRVTSRPSVTSKKCNRAIRAMRNWSFISAGLTSITGDCDMCRCPKACRTREKALHGTATCHHQ